MARSLDAILKELDAGYNPSRNLLNDRIKALGTQAKSEVDALKAQEQDYFENTILSGARARGLGFSGIPEGERARYGSTHYLPAVARVKEAQEGTRGSLLEALNQLNREQRGQAMSIRQWEQEQEQAASPTSFNLGGGVPASGTVQGARTGGGDPVIKQSAINEINKMMGRAGTKSFFEEVNAINKSASYGNAKDQAKLELLMVKQPGLFVNGQLNERRLDELWRLAVKNNWG